MPDVIEVLEHLGRSPELRWSSEEELARALRSHGVDPELERLLATADLAELEEALGARSNMWCLVRPPDEDDDEGGEEQEDDGERKDGDEPESERRALS